MTNSSAGLTREVPLEPGRSALLIVDVQNYCCDRTGGAVVDLSEADFEAGYGEYFRRLEKETIPNLQSLIAACRVAGVEVIYTVIEALTRDGRDRGLDYKITGFLVPKGSKDGRVIDAIAPGEDEIVLPKSASSVFNSTNIEYVLRNLGVERLAICGVYTEQCVESAVRDACDRGFLVTLIADACATATPNAHDHSLRAIKGYCRTVSTAHLVAELDSFVCRQAS
ncbi:MAG: isochorismatase family cysteine hydrolase [Alphaproteobacteria bacterium]|jgi:ureidoacrylate peracid hydrolase|nr:isochorismatase family cysteine hydrolase [Alphaproteobacteria bacterium]MDP6590426.1 isochorismatase family cysteine hydrolase [Alphaproteobacteria bacterium]|tara:strand:- start:118 stop:792 length:675 start_codon:yes stop_codon:yes gene_type:complete